MSGPPSLAGHPIVCLGFAEWDAELRTNQHHLMARLAQSSPVLFIESLGLRRPTASSRDLRRIVKRLLRGVRPLRRMGDVHVLSPLVIPFHGSRVVRAINRRLLSWAVRHALRRLELRHPLVLWTYVPQGRELIPILRPDLVVYHCVDDIAAHDRVDTEPFRRAEAELVREADLVITTAEPLRARLAEIAPGVMLMPNVADTESFARALDENIAVDAAMACIPSPRIVFVGAISAIKVDLELIASLARLRPGWSIALVGPVGLGDPSTDVSDLRKAPNVHLLGPRAHDALPGVLAAADAAIIPYRITPLTTGIFPMKVYEYLAAGLPTVSTPLPSLADVDAVAIAGTAEELVAALERELRNDTTERRRRRSNDARLHSWPERIEELERAVAELQWRR